VAGARLDLPLEGGRFGRQATCGAHQRPGRRTGIQGETFLARSRNRIASQSLAEEVRFLPYGELSSAALALGSASATSGPQLELAPGGAVLFGWTALVAALALARFVRQDI
jgi:hypothetical protein